MTVGGAWGKLLHVDLSDGRTWIERPSDDFYLKLLGGRALVAYLVLRDIPAGADPLGPDNLLVFAPGVLQGSNLPGSGRHGVGAKSPLTGAIASSEAGGWWGHEFKRSGFDALIVHGKAEMPVYLWIHDGEIEIRPAAQLWGKDTADVEWALQDELNDKKIRVAQCGVAGENEVLYACVIHDFNRAAGRGGLGAVMGSKYLRAVAVRGTLKVPVADRKRMAPVMKQFADTYEEDMSWAIKWGTPGGLIGLNKSSALPTRNFMDHHFDDAKSISGQLMHSTILIGRDNCMVCPVNCKQVVEYEVGEYPDNPAMKSEFYGKLKIDKTYGGPEYESLGSLGSACGVNDLLAVSKANELTARWGLDSISVGMTIAYVMECVDRGLLNAEQTQGYLPTWGDAQGLLDGVDMIAHRQGFGDTMAQGSKWLAEWIGNGADAYTVEVKGQELPMHEPRLKNALGVGYAVAPVGADHMMNFHDTGYSQPGGGLDRVAEVQVFEPMPANELSPRKMELFFHEVNWAHAQDCALTCHFYPYNYGQLAQALSGVTGHDFSPLDLLTVGERAQTLCRLFNNREGFSVQDDRLPRRVMKAFEEGPLQGIEITDEAFSAARDYWYGLMGWTDNGIPTKERLQQLGLMELLQDMKILA